ncbi:MAG: SPOR domain-containing protein [Saprospiraceae bacterium]|nr:SPOR domain-containing protein [Saprospiraceae bacterium]
MTTDINKAIQELLFEQTAVIVPGLGGFTSTPGTATVDYVQDIITPPASKLDFNPNLVINDGVLVQYLQKANLSTYQEAEALVDSFVTAVRGTLERREIYEIPKVGRLYQDYEQKIRFMPEGTNFNAASFGLPTIDFQPLVKEKPKQVTTPPKPLQEEVAATESAASADNILDEPPTTLAMKVLPWLVLLAAILIAIALYKMFGGPSKPIASVPETAERINVKPTLPADEEGTAASNAPAESSTVPASPATPNEDAPATVQQQPSSSQPTVAEHPKVQIGKPTTPPVTKPTETPAVTEAPVESGSKFYLVVHSFGKQGNATNFAKTLKGDGYSTKTKKVGSLYRVGVVFESSAVMEKERSVLANKYKAGPKTEKELEEMGQ